MKDQEENDKSNLSIHLVEPVVYLKDVNFPWRPLSRDELAPPSMVRGVLALHLSKPTKICSIGIELTATSCTRLPEEYSVLEEHQLYSSSTVYFRQEPGEHHPYRSTSLGPTSLATIGEGHVSSFRLPTDHEHKESSHARRYSSDYLASRRGGSVDLQNFHRDIVSHQAASRIPSPDYLPGSDATPDGTPAPPTASSSTTQLTPPRQESPPRFDGLLRAQSDPFPVQRDRRRTTPGANSVSTPPPASRRRGSQALEDFKRTLSSGTPSQVDLNVRPSNETRTGSPSSETPVQCSDDARHGRRGRSRFSLSTISGVIRDSVGSHSPPTAKEGAEGASIGPDVHTNSEKEGETARGRSREKRKILGRDVLHSLAKFSELFGLEHEEGREQHNGWKEYKKGTYKYPISFAIPANSPPSLECTFGSVVWTLTATVHRPGRLVPRMKTVHKINVVAVPGDDVIDSTEGDTARRTWKDQLVCRMSIFGRAFPIGSKIPFQLELLPLVKIKIHKVSITIDENVKYYNFGGKIITEHTKATRHVLCCLKCTDGLTPILPLTEEGREVSPLYALVPKDLQYAEQPEEERTSQFIAEWMGPGPWLLRFNLEIPNAYGALHPTNNNNKGYITVSHDLGVTIRFERWDMGTEGRERGKLFEILISYPNIYLLSHLCNREYTSLPQYSPTWRSISPPPGQPPTSETGPSSIVLEVPVTDLEHTPKCATSVNPAQGTIAGKREQLTHEFERLITGQEAETGESPPSYDTTNYSHV